MTISMCEMSPHNLGKVPSQSGLQEVAARAHILVRKFIQAFFASFFHFCVLNALREDGPKGD